MPTPRRATPISRISWKKYVNRGTRLLVVSAFWGLTAAACTAGSAPVAATLFAVLGVASLNAFVIHGLREGDKVGEALQKEIDATTEFLKTHQEEVTEKEFSTVQVLSHVGKVSSFASIILASASAYATSNQINQPSIAVLSAVASIASFSAFSLVGNRNVLLSDENIALKELKHKFELKRASGSTLPLEAIGREKAEEKKHSEVSLMRDVIPVPNITEESQLIAEKSPAQANETTLTRRLSA